MESSRSVSKITVNFFKTLDSHASNLGQIVEEAQTVNDHKLSEFEKKFEVVIMLELQMHGSYKTQCIGYNVLRFALLLL